MAQPGLLLFGGVAVYYAYLLILRKRTAWEALQEIVGMRIPHDHSFIEWCYVVALLGATVVFWVSLQQECFEAGRTLGQ